MLFKITGLIDKDDYKIFLYRHTKVHRVASLQICQLVTDGQTDAQRLIKESGAYVTRVSFDIGLNSKRYFINFVQFGH